MKNKKQSLTIVISCIFLGLTGCASEMNKESNISADKDESYTWNEVFSIPIKIKVQQMITGMAIGDKYSVLNPSDTNLHKVEHRYGPTPILAYWINHPKEGNFLIDAGLSKTFKKEGNYNKFMRSILSSMNVKTSQSGYKSAFEFISEKNITLNGIFFTHLHADHTSGARDFSNEVTLIFAINELDSMAIKTTGNHLEGKKSKKLNMTEGIKIPPFDYALDIFGDQSLWAVSTPGHSPDHLSYVINAEEGPVLITGDAIAYEAQLKYKINPTPFIHNYEKAVESINKLESFSKAFPSLKIFYGHDIKYSEATLK